MVLSLVCLGSLAADSPVVRAQSLEVVAHYGLMVRQGRNVESIAASGDGRHVYIAGSDGKGHYLLTLRTEADTTGLTVVGELREDTLAGLRDLVVSRDGRRLYGTPVVFDRDDATGLPTVAGHWPAPVGTRAIALSPDGRHLYAVSTDELVVLRADAVPMQELTRLTIGSETWPLSSIVASPDGRHVYVLRRSVDNRGGEVLAYARNADTGLLDQMGITRDGDDGHVTLGDLLSLAISPDGKQLYAGTTQFDPEIEMVTLARDAASGRLRVTAVRPFPDASAHLYHDDFGFTPDGTLLLRPPYFYVRAPASGGIVHVGRMPGDDLGPKVAAAAPDGVHVFMAPPVAILRRTCGDGVLNMGEACDDGNGTDGDGCDAVCAVEPCFTCAGAPSACTPTEGTACNDANWCTTGDTCSAGGCTGTIAADGTGCNDGNACTTNDSCAAGRCAGSGISCGACHECDRALGCVGALAVRCSGGPINGRPAGLLSLVRGGAPGRTLEWTWRGDGPTSAEALGDPTTAERLELCVFDQPDATFWRHRRRRVAFAATVPGGCRAGACWRRRADGSFAFRGSGAQSDGIRRVVLRPTTRKSAAVKLIGQGPHLPAAALPLSLELGAEAQLRSSDGTCFEAPYLGFVIANTRRAFYARGGYASSDDPSDH
jgi:cysteine-rich repeat protein